MTTAFALLLMTPAAAAYDIDDRLSVGGVLAGALQCADLSEPAGFDATCRGVVPVQPTASFRPGPGHEFFAKLGFASGNGLNDVVPFSVGPWAADLEDDVKNIHGRGRSYLLTAWYEYTRALEVGGDLSLTAGIIDSTEYLGGNAYASDEYSQFMNQALVSGPNAFTPSYDHGGVVEWSGRRWDVNALYMNVGSGSGGDSFDFAAISARYTLTTAQGDGHYHLLAALDSPGFLEDHVGAEQRHLGWMLSLDQPLSRHVGVWARIGSTEQNVELSYTKVLSGGVNLDGGLWRRPGDTVGIGYGDLNGGTGNLARTQVAEVYYRVVVFDNVGLTADLQFVRDELTGEVDPRGYILSGRADFRF